MVLNKGPTLLKVVLTGGKNVLHISTFLSHTPGVLHLQSLALTGPARHSHCLALTGNNLQFSAAPVLLKTLMVLMVLVTDVAAGTGINIRKW